MASEYLWCSGQRKRHVGGLRREHVQGPRTLGLPRALDSSLWPCRGSGRIKRPREPHRPQQVAAFVLDEVTVRATPSVPASLAAISRALERGFERQSEIARASAG